MTLVLATAHRDTLPIRQAPSEARWAESANSRQTDESEIQQSEPTKPSAPKYFGAGSLLSAGLRYESVFVLSGERESVTPILATRTVRLALLDLPPPAQA